MPNLFDDDPVIPKIVFFDFETNGFYPASVVEAYCLKCTYDGVFFSPTDVFHRYYFPKEEVNYQAVKIHGLTIDKIAFLRRSEHYSPHFIDDGDFISFAEDITHWVAHNISFDASFISLPMDRQFCTMKSNTDILAIPRNGGGFKYPNLSETAQFYGIPFDANAAHGASYDTLVLFDIFKEMHRRKTQSLLTFIKGL